MMSHEKSLYFPVRLQSGMTSAPVWEDTAAFNTAWGKSELINGILESYPCCEAIFDEACTTPEHSREGHFCAQLTLTVVARSWREVLSLSQKLADEMTDIVNDIEESMMQCD